MALNWAGWGAADKSTPQDRAEPDQQNPLVPYIDRYYSPGYKALSESRRQKRFGELRNAGVFQSADPALHALGGDGIQTGEAKSWTNYLEVQRGGIVGRVLGAVVGTLGKLAKPLLPGAAGEAIDLADSVLNRSPLRNPVLDGPAFPREAADPAPRPLATLVPATVDRGSWLLVGGLVAVAGLLLVALRARKG